jgi:hypothetical protein
VMLLLFPGCVNKNISLAIILNVQSTLDKEHNVLKGITRAVALATEHTAKSSQRNVSLEAFIHAIVPDRDLVYKLPVRVSYCNVLGFYSRWMFISVQKLNTLQLNTISNSPNTGQSLVALSVDLHVRTVPRRIVCH